MHDERARVLWRLSRFDEAIAELQRGLEVEDNGPNISQRVNLAEHYVFLNKPELALKTLDRLGDNATPYGHMAWEYQRLTAANELGDDSLEREALDYLRAHELDDPMFRGAALHGCSSSARATRRSSRRAGRPTGSGCRSGPT